MMNAEFVRVVVTNSRQQLFEALDVGIGDSGWALYCAYDHSATVVTALCGGGQNVPGYECRRQSLML